MNEFLSSEGNKCWQTQNTCNREQNWKKCNHRIFIERPRSPMAARGAIRAGRGTSSRTERDADSHSVDRIVELSRCAAL